MLHQSDVWFAIGCVCFLVGVLFVVACLLVGVGHLIQRARAR